MKNSVAIIRVFLLVVTIGSLSSCRHKDLYWPEPPLTAHLQVVFDWRNAPDADPESMAAYMYDENGQAPLRFIFDNKDGGEIKAPTGMHHLLFMNADNTGWVHLRNNDRIETMELSTLDAPALSAQGLDSKTLPRASADTDIDSGTESERIAATPGMLWGGRSDNHLIVGRGDETITLTPDELVCHYTVDIYDVENIGGLTYTSVDATLSGMAEAYGLGASAATDTPVTHPFVLTVDRDNSSMHSEFLTFGECSSTSRSHYLNVYMLVNDGSHQLATYDVTDQVSKAPDPRHVHIVVRGMNLPKAPESPGTLITPDVNEWQAVHIGLRM